MRALLVLVAVLGLAAAPRARLTPEQARLITEANRLWAASSRAWKAGKQLAALDEMRKALDSLTRAMGGWHHDTATVAEHLANAHLERDEWAEEAGYRRVVVEARSRLHGAGDWRTTDARVELAEALAQPGRTPAQRAAVKRAADLNARVMGLNFAKRYKEAVPLAREAVAIHEKFLGAKHPYFATILNNLAQMLSAAGDPDAALPLFLRTAEIQLRSLGRMHPRRAAALSSAGRLLVKKNDPRGALPLFREVLAINRALLGRKHPDTVGALDRIAAVLHDSGDLRGALPYMEEVCALRKELDGEGHYEHIRVLHNLAVMRGTLLGDSEASLALFRQALALSKRRLGEKHPLHAAILASFAIQLKDVGDLKSALPRSRQALALRRKHLGEKHPDTLTSLHDLAVVLSMAGDHESSLALHRQALSLRESLGKKHPDRIESMGSLATVLLKGGDRKAALALMEEAFTLAKEVHGEKHPTTATLLNNLAQTQAESGQVDAALASHRRALAVLRAIYGEQHPAVANSLGNFALLLRRKGDLKAALAMHRQALAIQEKTLGERHSQTAASLLNLASLLHKMDDNKSAAPYMERAMASVLGQLRDSAAALSDQQQLTAAANARIFLTSRLAMPDLPDRVPAAAHVLDWKGALLARQRQRRLFLRLVADPASKRDAERLQAVSRRLAVLHASEKANPAALTAAANEQEEAQARLSAASAVFRAEQDKDRATPASLAKGLPEGVVLVDYIFHDQKLTAFIYRRGKEPTRVMMDSKDVGEAVREWWSRLAKAKPDRTQATRLKSLVWSPLEKHLTGATVILISPDGELGTVPFAALPGKKEGTYLIEDAAIAVVPAGSAVPDLLKPNKDRLKPTLLAVGDLRYQPEEGTAAPPAAADDRSAPRAGREKFVELAATRAEVLAVRSSFEKLFKDGKATALTEGQATKKAVRDALPKSRYAHLATHGWFTSDSKAGWHPLLLSGLALSDANRIPKDGEEDGILTALEVSEMDLTKLELATLSACETGLGKVAAGEGILGMQRAFQAAGARSVVASLWKVGDKATMELMADFYAAAWGKKIISRAEALRQTQLSMLKEGRRRGIGTKAEKLPEGGTRLPPFYWAGFVLSGDWR